MTRVRDGRAEVGCSLEDWYMGRAPGALAGAMPKLARAIGASIPPLDRVADEAPAQARIDWGRWVADCPCGGASLVWVEGPHQAWCATCGNADLGGAWRRVLVPENAAQLAEGLAALGARDQQWRPDEA